MKRTLSPQMSRSFSFARRYLVTAFAGAAILCAGCFGQGLDRASIGIPPREWVRTYSRDSSQTNKATVVRLTSDNRCVVGGSSQNSTNNLDYQFLKYQPQGDVEWQYRFDSGGQDELRAMVADSETNVVATGTSRTVKIGAHGEKQWELNTPARDVTVDSDFVYVAGFSEIDVSVAKFSKEGGMIWTRTRDAEGIQGDDVSQKIVADQLGNVYPAGKRAGGCDPRVGCIWASGIFKYSASGDFVWQGDSTAADLNRPSFVEAMAEDSHANVFFLYNNEPRNFGIVGFTQSGSYLFPDYGAVGVRIGPYGYGHALALTSSDDIFAAGSVAESFQSLNSKATVVKIGADGTLEWRTDFPNIFFGKNELLSIALDGTNFVYAAGYLMNANSDLDFAVFKYSQNGELLWADIYDGPAHKDDVATSIAVDKNGNVYATGYSTTAQGGTEFVTIKYSAAPAIQNKTDGTMHLEFHTNPGQKYSIEATGDFFNWRSLITNTADANGRVQFDDTDTTSIPYRFYRGNANP